MRNVEIRNILKVVPVLTGLGLIDCDLRSTDVVLNRQFRSLRHLDHLALSSNLLELVNLVAPSSLRTARRADFSFNRISRVHVTAILPHLEELILGPNGLHSFPDTCTKRGESYFPNLRQLNLAYNKIQTTLENICLPNLQVLILDGNQFIYLGGNVSLTGDMFPSLIFASFQNTIVESFEDQLSFKFSDMPSLECVDLSRNGYFLITELIQYFHNCSRLRRLDISDNQIFDDLDEYTDDDIENMNCCMEPQQSIQNVEFLNLSSCKTDGSLWTLIHKLPNLVVLDISYNKLHVIPNGFFDSLIKLRHLNLSSNFVTVVSQDVFSAVTRGRLQTLNFAFNPFECTCDNLWFKSWIASSPNKFMETEYYFCEFMDSAFQVKLLDFKLSEQACLMSHTAYVAITYVTLFTLLFAVITVSFWRYQWHLRLLLYDIFRGPGDARLQRLQHGHFDYDVFVSYDSDDQLWVFGKLLPELEGRLGLRLCVHERDFVPGTQIIDNIAKCVEASKKILMVWSRNFVDSKWCQFELTYCLQHTMDTEDALVIVCLDDVTSTNDVTTAMMAVLKTTTYIQWVGERRGQAALDSFWGRLRVALKEVISEAEDQV